MCGIIGVIMKPNINDGKQIINHIEKGLYRLQNRGYDSCGIGLINDSEVIIEKYASTDTSNSLSLLSDGLRKRKELSLPITTGIGHNRWATHGAKTNENAHPHISYDRKFMIVHNGIIENHVDLKTRLASHTLLSETDSEIIAHLLSHYYDKTNNTLESIRLTINDLQGTYGLVIIKCDEPNTLYCVKNGSPLLVGISEDVCIVTSEQSGFNNSVETYITLINDDICTLEIYNNDIILRTLEPYTYMPLTAPELVLHSPSPFEHWTLKEIHEQPTTILNNINMGGRINGEFEVKLCGLDVMSKQLQSVKHLIILGCGSSYNAALYGEHFVKQLCNFVTVQAFDAAELQQLDLPKTTEPVAIIFVSQSGETKDLHKCFDIVNTMSPPPITIGVVNVVDSLIACEVDCGVYCNSGVEVGVASTKSFTSQVVCLTLVALWFAGKQGVNRALRGSVIKSLRNLSNDYINTIANVSEQVKKISKSTLNHTKSMFILGKGCDMYIASESALKIKEISYIHTESYSTSSLKHGPFALLSTNFPVIIINSGDEYNQQSMNCYEEIKSRNAPIILITNKMIENLKGDIIVIPNNKHFSGLLSLIPLQLLAYSLSINNMNNPDKPRNLAKVVTVE